MASIMDVLGKQLGGGMMGQLSQQLGSDEKKTGAATNAALTTLLSALARNAATNEGAGALHRALQKDHDGSILADAGKITSHPQATSGAGILGHILGNRRPVVEKSLSKSTGLDAGSTAQLLTTLAPVLMGALGKAQREQGLDSTGLASMLGQERETIERATPKTGGIMASLLDKDGDGDVDMGDIASHGMGIFGKLFGR